MLRKRDENVDYSCDCENREGGVHSGDGVGAALPRLGPWVAGRSMVSRAGSRGGNLK